MRFSRGFTLIELMVTLAVLAIVIVVAVPGMTNIIESNRLQTVRDHLQTAVLYAKSEAISRNRRVSICSSTAGAACDPVVNWSNGWIIYEDNSLTPAATIVGTILRRQDAPQQTEINYAPAGAPDFIQFRPNGISNLAVDVVWGVCDADRSVSGFSLLVSRLTAQIRRGTVADANC